MNVNENIARLKEIRKIIIYRIKTSDKELEDDKFDVEALTFAIDKLEQIGKEEKMTGEFARQQAAQAWCAPCPYKDKCP